MSVNTTAETDTAVTKVYTRMTNRWWLLAPAALVAAGVGVLFSAPALLITAVVGVGVLAYQNTVTGIDLSVDLSREITPPDPDPGDAVTIETTVSNTGGAVIPELRVIDGIPAELSVTEGTTRVTTTLRPGETETFSYSVIARRGRHPFGPATVSLRDPTGAVETSGEITTGDTVVCRPTPTALPRTLLGELTTPYAGQLTTSDPGSGVEFHTMREYQRGDDVGRIDWNQFAATGELRTQQFRTERSATVLILADLRAPSFHRPGPTADHAAFQIHAAVGRLFVSLLDAGHRVGLATMGPSYWLAPDAGQRHRTEGLQALGSDPEWSPGRTATEQTIVRQQLRRIRRQLGRHTQVIVCTPLLDRESKLTVTTLAAAGHSPTVLAPAPTATAEGAGGQFSRLDRSLRVGALRRQGIPVVDWDPDTALETALTQTRVGRS